MKLSAWMLVALLVAAIASYGMALIGEPQSAWLWFEMIGVGDKGAPEP